MTHIIRLGDGTRVPVGAYVRAWKSMLTLEGDAIIPLDLCNPATCRAPQRVEAAVLQFRRGMHARINRHVPWHNRGRKWSAEWWFPTLRVAQYANNRVILRPGDVPAEYHSRLKHRITWPWEE